MKQSKQPQSSNRETVKQQILAVRDSGKTNMFDLNAVARIAFDNEYYELVDFITKEPRKYVSFIIGSDDEMLPE